jgi:hypothetical protein
MVQIYLKTGQVIELPKVTEFSVKRNGFGEIVEISYTIPEGRPRPLYINLSEVVAVVSHQ